MSNILLTGARSPITLDLARCLHQGGHRVYVADCDRYHICRFSNCIEKSLVIPSPRLQTDAFLEHLIKEINRCHIELLIPTSEEVIYIAKHQDKIPKQCRFFASSFETLCELHNKWLFYRKLESLNIPTPHTVLIPNKEKLNSICFPRPYILKACHSRASQSIVKVTSGEPPPIIPFESNNPWIAQEWLEGKRLCSYSIALNGHLQAHTTYPVQFSIDRSSCLTFTPIHHEKIHLWVKMFVKEIGFTGQIAFDFIEVDKDQLYAIECNPRSTSGLYLLTRKPDTARAFTSNQEIKTIFSHEKEFRQIGVGMLVYGWQKKHSDKSFEEFVRTFFKAQDVVYDSRDKFPFWSQPVLFLMYMINCIRKRKSLPAAFTYEFDWNGEL